MPVKEADPEATSLDAAFADAMGAPPRPREPSAPPELDPDAPHGRGDDGEPLAPYGLTRDGRPRKSPAGRKPKDDQARTAAPAEVAAKAAAAAPALPGHDYTPALTEFADALWLVATGTAMVGPKLPLLGRLIPGDKIAAQAFVIRNERLRLATGLNIAAQHNTRARALAEKIEAGNITWVLMCGYMAMPFFAMSVAVWQGDSGLTARELPSLAQLAASNQAAVDQFMAQVEEQMQAAHAEAGVAAGQTGEEA